MQPQSNAVPLVEPKVVDKPWGREVWYAHEERYAGKILEVTRGHALSLQKPVEPKVVDKPWGREVWYAHEERYAGKILEVTRGHALSLQKHERKQETMYLQSGRLLYHFNGVEFEMVPGQCITIRPGDVHRIEALEDAVILEVSTPELDDIIRLEDRYGRG